MQSKFYSQLRSSLLLSTGLSLGLATLLPVAEARIISNGTFPNGISLNGVVLNGTSLEFNSGSVPHLQLEGSQLVLHFNH